MAVIGLLTSRMLQLSLFGIPIFIEWFFWLSCVLLGGGLQAQTSDAWIRVAIWTWVVLISITVHEIGHALAARRFGVEPIIRLHGFGGVTILHRAYFTRWQSIFVSAAGPLSGFALGLWVYLVSRFVHTESDLLEQLIFDALYVNFFWTLVNLLPIQPLDGGQIFRELMGSSRIHITNIVGVVCAVAVAVWAFRRDDFYLGIMMLYLAYRNYSSQYGEGGVMTE